MVPNLPPLSQAKKHLGKIRITDAIDDIRIHLQHADRDAYDKKEIEHILIIKTGQWHQLKSDRMAGVVTKEQASMKQAMIINGLLEIILQLEQD